jgi:hypothetical protein
MRKLAFLFANGASNVSAAFSICVRPLQRLPAESTNCPFSSKKLASSSEVPLFKQAQEGIDEKGAVARAEDIFQENFEVVLVFFGEVLLAAAGVEDQAERERDVHAAGEMGDFLWDGVFHEVKVVFL